MDATLLEYVVHAVAIGSTVFGATMAGAKCATRHFRETLFRIADQHMESLEAEIDKGRDNLTTRLIQKVVRPELEDIREQIEGVEQRLTDRFDTLAAIIAQHHKRD